MANESSPYSARAESEDLSRAPKGILKSNNYLTRVGKQVPCSRNFALFKDTCLLLDYEGIVSSVGAPSKKYGVTAPDITIETIAGELVFVDVEYEDRVLQEPVGFRARLEASRRAVEQAGAQLRIISDSIRDENRNRLFVLNVITHNALIGDRPLDDDDSAMRVLREGPGTVRTLLSAYSNEEVRQQKLCSICWMIANHQLELANTPTGFLADALVCIPTTQPKVPSYLMSMQRFTERIARHPLKLVQMGGQLPFAPGTKEFNLGGYRYDILDDRTPERVFVKEHETGEVYRLAFESIPSPEGDESFMRLVVRDGAHRTKRAEKALERYDVISLLGDRPRKEDYENVANTSGYSVRTLKRIRGMYKVNPSLAALGKPRKDAGKGKLRNVVERIVGDTLVKFYGKTSMKEILKMVRKECESRQVPPEQWPSRRTLYSRVQVYVPQVLVLTKKFGKTRTENMMAVFTGTQLAEFPLHKVQFDCHQCDLITAYEYGGKKINTGRPWLTLAKDRYSGKVVGRHVSLLDPTSFGAVFLTVADVALHHGRPSIIVVDKGKVYRSDILVMGCAENNIRIHWSREYTPQDKGAVERFFRTVEEGCFGYLDGRTGSNALQRRDLDPEAEAKHSVEEVEVALARFIKDYNDAIPDNGLLSPNQKFAQGMSERGIVPYRIPPDKVPRFKISFMGWANRTIQKDGVSHLNMHFSGSKLAVLKRSDNQGNSVPYLIRWDPSDIRRIYILDQERNEYYELLNMELTGDPRFEPRQPVSLQRWRQIQRERSLRDPTSTLLHFDSREKELETRLAAGDRDAAKELAAARKELEDRRKLGMEQDAPVSDVESSLSDYNLPDLDPGEIDLLSDGKEETEIG